MTIRVLFVCTSNSARSQMAEALLYRVPGFDAHSAGIYPAAKINPLTVKALASIGIDRAGATPMSASSFVDGSWAYVITLSPEAKAECPEFPGAKRLDWLITDPTAEGTDAAFRAVMADLSTRIDAFVKVASAAGKESPMSAVKFVKGAPDRIAGLAVPFGGLLKGKDLDGEFFDASSDLCLPWFGETGRPVLYGHGLNPATKAEVVGRQTSLDQRDDGWWIEAELDKNSRYRTMIGKLVEQDALSFSSGAMPHLVRTGKDGRIERWPWVETSLTPTPSNALAVVYAVKSADMAEHYAAANIDIPAQLIAIALKALDEEPIRDSSPDGLTYAEESDRLLDALKAFVERTQGLADLRAKSGRTLSAANRDRLSGHVDAIDSAMGSMGATVADMRALLTATDPEATKRSAMAELARFDFLTATLP